jgi:hypothetical protein
LFNLSLEPWGLVLQALRKRRAIEGNFRGAIIASLFRRSEQAS